MRYLERAPADLERPGAWLMRVLVNGCRSRLRLAWRRVGPLPDDLTIVTLRRPPALPAG